MIATAITGAMVSSLVFVAAAAVQISNGLFGGRPGGGDILSNPFTVAVLVAIPFIILGGYLSYRVNRHTDRLSRGKFEPRLIFEEE